jgi:hypothetical protein
MIDFISSIEVGFSIPLLVLKKCSSITEYLLSIENELVLELSNYSSNSEFKSM